MAQFERQTRQIRCLIWLYLILWLIDGGLRRWILPGLAAPLLLIRDPLVLYIYLSTYRAGLFPESFFISGMSDGQVHATYAAATALICPSLEEGFGWPIAEAQACGCPVITTGRPPMTEVGGSAAWYLPRRNPADSAADETWVREGAALLKKLVGLSGGDRSALVAAGKANAGRFAAEPTVDRIAGIYQAIVSCHETRVHGGK